MRKIAICLTMLAWSASTTALADPSVVEEGVGTSTPAAGAPADRGYLFTADPSLAAPLQVVVAAGMGNVTRSGEERPAGAGDIVPTIGAEVGVLKRLSFYVDVGAVFWSQSGMPVSPVTVEAGARILLTNPDSRNFLLTLQPSYGLDFFGNNTFLLNAAAAWSHGPLRVVASTTASHTFQPGADSVDLEASLGATVRIPMGFRVGVEGVVTDLEELTMDGAEGGTSAFVGPTVGWEWRRRFQIVAGPAYGVGPNYSGWLGRVAASVYL